MYENLDVMRVELKNNQTGETEFKNLTPAQMEDDANFIDKETGADLGKLVSELDNGTGGAFVAKFTSVVAWPKTSFSTYPDVPQGMRLSQKPNVVQPWADHFFHLNDRHGHCHWILHQM